MNFLISTLVLLTRLVSLVSGSVFLSFESASAATHSEGPAPKRGDDPDVVAPPEKLENISVSPVKQFQGDIDAFVTKYNRNDFFYPYRQELIWHAGIVIGFKDSSNSSNIINPLLGFDYILPREFSPKYETGADLSLMTARGHFWFVRRRIINEKGSFRPYYSYGLMHNFVPDQRLASFSNSENYLVRVAAGLENIMQPPKSAIVELVLAVGQNDMLMMFTYGASWGF